MLKKKKKYFISFLGGIGAGKTISMELVAKKFGFLRVKEQYGKNKFLPLFYKDMSRWALSSQLFFLSEKFDQMIRIKEMLKKKSVVLDVDINQDLCYLETQKSLGNINSSEYALYYKIYKCMKLVLPKPDLIIYLKSSLPVLRERINERGRPYEKGLSDAYLRALIGAQEKWVRKNKKSLPIVTIDGDKLSFAHRVKDREKFVGLVRKLL